MRIIAVHERPGVRRGEVTMRYEGCARGAEVRLIRIDGPGHRWTRDEVDTTRAMWRFFKGHTLE